MAGPANNMNNPAHALDLVTASVSTMSNRESSRHSGHPHWLLELVTGGALEVRTGEMDWLRLEHGGGILYRPGTYHEERVRAGVCTSQWMFFDMAGEDLTESLPPGRSAWIVSDPDGLALQYVEAMRALPRITFADQLAAHGHLCQLMSSILSASATGATLLIREQTALTASVVDCANRFMRRHLADTCRVEDVAAHVGLSPSGLHHAYRRLSGRSPMAVLREMRVEAAKAMLLRGSMTLDQIAVETGFADAFHLSRTFKKQEGCSPRAFLRLASG